MDELTGSPRQTAPSKRALPVAKVVLLLFGSGFCALVYQVAWLRLFRLIFGSSTPATAAVLAIFMGGIGLGSLVLGPRADRKLSPLGYYAKLEMGIALSAAASPLLILFCRWVYISLGGSLALGTVVGSMVRILLSLLVLGLPTFLMGGTLPAVTRAVERSEDRGRRLLGLLYGGNTLGAVLGALITTFFSIEVLGIRRTIWLASAINLLVAILARAIANQSNAAKSTGQQEASVAVSNPVLSDDSEPPRSLVRWVLLAAAGVGFIFFLMELVWYRMLAPLLGGSSYTFGLILAVALLGIGIGGLIYGAGSHSRRPTLTSFATTCSLEALFLIIPFALGDRLAAATLVLRDLGGMGFVGLTSSWFLIVAFVVLPPAVVAGYQFPLLVAILGSGRTRVAKQVGWTYAWNTAGAIAGSLAGGFGLLPLLSATGAWRLSSLFLVLLAAAAIGFDFRYSQRSRLPAAPTLLGVMSLVLCLSAGPTAFWRHSPIGAGRLSITFEDWNQLRNAIHRKNRVMMWEADGLESSIGMLSFDGAAFMINGKVDGHARSDAPTQVMSGLLGAALHPEPRRSLIIGLGTGSTAGWLARVPTMEQVDVVELEPEIVRVAEDCEPVNEAVLANPKVRLIIGDGREILLTTEDRFDVIFSEPSNPYRAGIASLFTQDFYRAVIDRLSEGGIFVQWLQGYEIDGQVVRTALATLGTVFPTVEVWKVSAGDLLLLASNQPISHDPERIRRRLRSEPFRTAMNRVWGVASLEGFYAGFVADDSFTRSVLAQEERWINTDDRPIIEFGFARNVGRFGLFKIPELRDLVARRGEDRPAGLDLSQLNWSKVEELRSARQVAFSEFPAAAPSDDPDLRARVLARQHFERSDLTAGCDSWLAQEESPVEPIDVLMLGECLGDRADARAVSFAELLGGMGRKLEADAVLARFFIRSGDSTQGVEHLISALTSYHTDPWPHLPTMSRLLVLASEVGRQSPPTGREIVAALEQPFSIRLLDETRRVVIMDIAFATDFEGLCSAAIGQYEPWTPWEEHFLRQRLRCLELTGGPGRDRARQELTEFLARAPLPLESGLRPEPSDE